jgi:ankyrin repeat protein
MKRTAKVAGMAASAHVLFLAAITVGVLWYAVDPRPGVRDHEVRTIHDNARLGRVGDVERALARGTPVDLTEERTGRTPLMFAAGAGREAMVRVLLSRGARLEATSPTYGTPLSAATAAGDPGMMRLLLARGADPNGRSGAGVTPLMVSAVFAREDTTAVLIAGGARVNVADRKGTTPLMIAASGGCDAIVRRLIAAGADVRACDRTGRDVAELAVAHGEPRTAALIARHAATHAAAAARAD